MRYDISLWVEPEDLDILDKLIKYVNDEDDWPFDIEGIAYDTLWDGYDLITEFSTRYPDILFTAYSSPSEFRESQCYFYAKGGKSYTEYEPEWEPEFDPNKLV